MRSHVMETTSACFAVLRRLRGICRSVDCLPVLPATAAGLLQCSVGWNSITPCTALAIGDERGRHTTRDSSSHHQSATTSVTPLLRQLHWLKVRWRIDYNLAVLLYKVFMAWHCHTSLMNFITSRFGLSKAFDCYFEEISHWNLSGSVPLQTYCVMHLVILLTHSLTHSLLRLTS